MLGLNLAGTEMQCLPWFSAHYSHRAPSLPISQAPHLPGENLDVFLIGRQTHCLTLWSQEPAESQLMLHVPRGLPEDEFVLSPLLSLPLVFLIHDMCGIREKRANLLAQNRCQVLIKL